MARGGRDGNTWGARLAVLHRAQEVTSVLQQTSLLQQEVERLNLLPSDAARDAYGTAWSPRPPSPRPCTVARACGLRPYVAACMPRIIMRAIS